MADLNKTMNVAEIVGQLESGMTIGVGGWGARRKPMALIREILKTDLTDLSIVAYGGCDVGMLAAAGKLRKLTFGFVSLDSIPLEKQFRQKRQQGTFEVNELDEGMVQLGLKAAAMRVPFLPTPVGLASDVLTHNPHLKTVTSPYDDGAELVAMPALRLDVALCHVNKADPRGNSWIYGPDPFFDEWFARAADKTYLTTEQLVTTADLDVKSEAIRMPIDRCHVNGVAEVPMGAHPTSCAPDYGIDVKFLKNYSAALSDEEWAAWVADHVTGKDQAAYIETAGGADAVRSLPLPVF